MSHADALMAVIDRERMRQAAKRSNPHGERLVRALADAEVTVEHTARLVERTRALIASLDARTSR